MRRALGRSAEGRAIEVFSTFPDSLPLDSPRAGEVTLLVGCTHGDERATVDLLESFIKDTLEQDGFPHPVAVIPTLNPDGYARDTRYNARGVDLNRNFPHNWSPHSEEPPGDRPLSEPEARLLHDYILALRPAKIVSLHWALAEIDADGPQSTPLARHVWDSLTPAQKAPYRLRTDHVGHAPGTPGSLGQWCGYGLRYPGSGHRPAMITLELPWHPHEHPRPENLPEDHLDTLRSLWDGMPSTYLDAVSGGVHRLLEAACRFDLFSGKPAR
jgi:hypothetical protein